MGTSVPHLPSEIDSLYEEARRAGSVSSYTALVLCCRKLLMHVAVEKGAPAGKNFLEYVNHLDTNGYIPKEAKDWVDYLRTRGNEANHEITLYTEEDAEHLLDFVEMLLRLVYDFPARLKSKPTK